MVHPAFFEKHRNLAMLIDAENTPTTVLSRMLEQVSLYGVPMIRRAYGDWTKLSSKSVNSFKEHGVRLIQQTSYVSGKNASDIRLVIDAMDMLHAGNMQGFCIVSSDSDFTGLCNRIREEGLFVMGIGKAQVTHTALRQACHLFIHIEDLQEKYEQDHKLLQLLEPQQLPNTDTHLLPASNPVAELRKTQHNDNLQKLLKRAYILAQNQEEKWVNLSAFGSMIQQTTPDFNCKEYGNSKLSTLIKNNHLLMDIQATEDNIGGGYKVCLRIPSTKLQKKKLYQVLAKAYHQCITDNFWVDLGKFGNCLHHLESNFDYTVFGYDKLSDLIKVQPCMEIKSDNDNGNICYQVRYVVTE